MTIRWVRRGRLGLARPSPARDRAALVAEVAAEAPAIGPGPVI
jgi:hypothetical protein